MSVCNIAAPSTPLEAKFSIRHAVALALLGYDLADGESFSAATRDDPKVVDLRERIRVAGDAGIKRANARIDAHLGDGSTLSVSGDASRAETDLAHQARRVEAKFAICARESINEASIARTIEMCRELERVSDITTLVAALRTPGTQERESLRDGSPRPQAVKDRA
jgi:2-methylcitrate dehydratase PrpD